MFDTLVRYIGDKPDVVVSMFITFVGVVLSAIITSIVTCRVVDGSRKKSAKRVAKVIMETFKNEIEKGIKVLESFAGHSQSIAMMPTATFDSYSFTTDIIEVIVDQNCKKTKNNGFPQTEFLIHLKNYYKYVCLNVNNKISLKIPLTSKECSTLIDSSKNVLVMVENIISSLS